MSPENVSLRPSEMVEGGAVPVDKNLTVKEARFVIFDYQGKAPKPVTAARLILVDDDGVESTQHFSAADTERFVPSSDGKSIVPVGTATALNRSSNFYVLMNESIKAGFPENKLGADISVFDGLYAYWIGIPEPKRPGLVRTPEQAARGDRVIPVPSQILRLPWEKAGGKAKPAAKATKAAEAEDAGDGGDDNNVTDKAVAFVGKVVAAGGGASTRQKIAAAVFKDLAKDPDRDAIAQAVFSPELSAALMGAGFAIKGENISKK